MEKESWEEIQAAITVKPHEQFGTVDTFALDVAIKNLLAKVEQSALQRGRISMWEDLKLRILPKAQKFIKKVESGRARSKETYADMQEIEKMFALTPPEEPNK